MNKEYLPFYDSLSQKDKDFWLKCSKETLIDHFISNVRNGETLLSRIEKALEYIEIIDNKNSNIDISELRHIYRILKGESND